jgi:hypothetical protein
MRIIGRDGLVNGFHAPPPAQEAVLVFITDFLLTTNEVSAKKVHFII